MPFNVDGYTITESDVLPPASSIYAPTDVIFALGDPDSPRVGLTASQGDSRSPFENKSGYESSPFDSVLGGSVATFGTGGLLTLSSFLPAVVPSNPFGTGVGSFSFIYGSPDSYNNLTINTSSGPVSFSGSQLTNNNLTRVGYVFTTISGLGAYDGVTFSSDQNSFEFSATSVSPVPLPASLPLFGAGILGLAAFGYSRRKAKAQTDTFALAA